MTPEGQRILDAIRAERRSLPMHEILAERDPKFLEGYNAIYNAAHNLTQIGVVYASVKNYLAAQRGIVC